MHSTCGTIVLHTATLTMLHTVAGGSLDNSPFTRPRRQKALKRHTIAVGNSVALSLCLTNDCLMNAYLNGTTCNRVPN